MDRKGRGQLPCTRDGVCREATSPVQPPACCVAAGPSCPLSLTSALFDSIIGSCDFARKEGTGVRSKICFIVLLGLMACKRSGPPGEEAAKKAINACVTTFPPGYVVTSYGPVVKRGDTAFVAPFVIQGGGPQKFPGESTFEYATDGKLYLTTVNFGFGDVRRCAIEIPR
jgi:hypothetical protein